MTERFSIFVVTLLTIAAIITFAATLVSASLTYMNEDDLEPIASSTEEVREVSTPVKQNIPTDITIPAIEVEAKVVDVGIGKTGNMAVPRSYSEAGWYRYGTTPGKRGSAVINGHADNGFGLDAVFKNIGELEPGDEIYIETKGGKELTFVVEDVQTYDVEDVPLQRLFNRADTSRLNLITCTGEWDEEKKAYDQRIVVYAKLL
ncbi:MAG TPA: class F sortase [Candidatus Paceibacterota bacterium]|nr:class F sortase [Candidatus Paceibacterota bacterium]